MIIVLHIPTGVILEETFENYLQIMWLFNPKIKSLNFTHKTYSSVEKRYESEKLFEAILFLLEDEKVIPPANLVKDHIKYIHKNMSLNEFEVLK